LWILNHPFQQLANRTGVHRRRKKDLFFSRTSMSAEVTTSMTASDESDDLDASEPQWKAEARRKIAARYGKEYAQPLKITGLHDLARFLSQVTAEEETRDNDKDSSTDTPSKK